ncbi:hypothetical protein [Brevundimonas sp.]|uniref:hypothetical protein n=1 Tax=Brevundimonas sp. TaxID=1871086 RepID=UPI0035617182
MTLNANPLDWLRAANSWLWRVAQPFVPWVIVGALCLTGAAVLTGMTPLDSPLVAPRQYDQGFDFRIEEKQPSCYGSAIDALPVGERAAKQEACDLAREQLRNAREGVTQAVRTTNAAEEELRLSWQQTLIAFFQAILTVLALVFTGWAAFAASRAARAAEASTRHAETAMKIELRAYLHVQSIKVVWSTEGQPAFDVVCTNTGQTPARWFELSVWAIRVASGARTPSMPADTKFSLWPVPVGSGSERSARVVPEGSDNLRLRVDFQEAGSTIFALGILRYEDVFGVVHSEEFRAFKRSPNGRPESMAFATDAKPADENLSVVSDAA